jgi:signal transduction histidine kinase
VKPRSSIQRKYVALVVALVGGALLVSGATSMYRTYVETRAALLAVEREHAVSASIRIENFVDDIARQLGWTSYPQITAGANPLEARRYDFLKLQNQVKEITEATYIDAQGREQVFESRLKMSDLGSGKDLRDDPRFKVASEGRTYFGPVEFRKETEPYMAIAVPAGKRGGGGVTAVEVNLKFMWEVIRGIHVGKTGFAYVVDRQGRLIAHPDISLVLQKTDLSSLPQVRAALSEDKEAAAEERLRVSDARDQSGKPVLTAYARIDSLGWAVFVEQSADEAYQPLYASLMRTGGLLVAGLLLSIIAGFVFARRMVEPIRALQAGAEALGAGDLGQRIEVRTGDELEALGERFNDMAGKLAASYAGLERKVEERTQELQNTLEQQTATAEILRAISASPSDVAPVFEAILDSATRLCDGPLSAVFRYEDGLVHLIAHRNWTPSVIEEMKKDYPAPPSTKLISGRTILSGQLQHEEDAYSDPDYDHRVAVTGGWRRLVGVPIKHGNRVLGAIAFAWPTPGRTPERQVRLLETFAEQAAIAIENVRLFNETKEALEQQQASAEVLGVISSSVADTQPVFDKVTESCQRLFNGLNVGINVVGDDGQIHLASYTGPSREELERVFPVPLSPESGSGSAILQRKVLHYPDIEAAEVPDFARRGSRAGGNRAVIFAPILWEGKGIGAIHVGRAYVGPFSEKEIALLRHFADQTAIAIQNAHLFREIEDKSHQLEVANKHKSDFLANMSHELRTPLNAIIGFSEVLIEKMFGEVNEKQLDYLQDIHASGRHLLSLINDILDLSKIEAGRMELDLADVNMADALSSAMTLVRERAQNHGIELALEVDPQVEVVQADERKVKQVVLNLLSNAVKFTPDGGKIAMRATLDTDHVAVAVRDTGIGIAPEDQDAVFEEFKQVGRDYTKKAEGTGLGLALTRRIVELHGGRIWLESTPGKGSTFTFTLPLIQEKGAQ